MGRTPRNRQEPADLDGDLVREQGPAPRSDEPAGTRRSGNPMLRGQDIRSPEHSVDLEPDERGEATRTTPPRLSSKIGRWLWNPGSRTWLATVTAGVIATVLGGLILALVGDGENKERTAAPTVSAARPAIDVFRDAADRVCLEHYDRMQAASEGTTYEKQVAAQARIAVATVGRLRRIDAPIQAVIGYREYVAARQQAAEARSRLAASLGPPWIESAVGQAGVDMEDAQEEATSSAARLDFAVCGEKPELE